MQDVATPANASTAALAPGLHRFSRMERVWWGRPAASVLAEELSLLNTQRVFVVTTRSLSGSAELAAIKQALGSRAVGWHDRIRAHAPREDVVDAAAAARAAGCDLLLALGGGSVIDATKAVALCLRHDIEQAGALDAYAGAKPPDLGRAPPDAERWVRVVAVPTTLSGAEFAASAGVTDTARRMKQPFVHPMQMPVSVILDPAMTLSAPLPLLKSTGMKAVDHAAERMTSVAANAYSDAVSALALQLLSDSLLRLDGSPGDLAVRSALQYGMFMSLCGSTSGVAVNVSHAIGHVLGGHAGVPHGQTTGVALPAVLRWNHAETHDVQRNIARLLGADGGDAADAVQMLARKLGLPVRLRDVGVSRDDFAGIASKTMHEALLKNSRKPVRIDDVKAILELAW